MHITECTMYAMYPKLAKKQLGSSTAMCARMRAHFLEENDLQADPVWHETPAVSSAARLADWKLQSLHLPPFVAVRPETQSQVSLTNHKFQFLVLLPKILLGFLMLHVFYTDFCRMPTHRALGSRQQLCKNSLQLVPAKC